jgi:hypothetical protein
MGAASCASKDGIYGLKVRVQEAITDGLLAVRVGARVCDPSQLTEWAQPVAPERERTPWQVLR